MYSFHRVEQIEDDPHVRGEDLETIVRFISCRDDPHVCGEEPPRLGLWPPGQDDPRMCGGRRGDHSVDLFGLRMIPTRVGKTWKGCWRRRFLQDDPHGCGEDPAPVIRPFLFRDDPHVRGEYTATTWHDHGDVG